MVRFCETSAVCHENEWDPKLLEEAKDLGRAENGRLTLDEGSVDVKEEFRIPRVERLSGLGCHRPRAEHAQKERVDNLSQLRSPSPQVNIHGRQGLQSRVYNVCKYCLTPNQPSWFIYKYCSAPNRLYRLVYVLALIRFLVVNWLSEQPSPLFPTCSLVVSN